MERLENDIISRRRVVSFQNETERHEVFVWLSCCRSDAVLLSFRCRSVVDRMSLRGRSVVALTSLCCRCDVVLLSF